MTPRSILAAACLAASLLAVVSAQTPEVRDAAMTMQRKLVAIADFGERPARPRRAGQVLRTVITDHETNAFFRVNGPLFMPDGVKDAQVTIAEGGRVTARALVDLDKALKPKDRNWLDPLAYVGGTVEVTATGTLKASGGRGQFTLERTTLGGVPVPNVVMQELVTYYSKSPDNPTGIRLDQPFELPSKIQAVTTARGVATVVQ